MHRFYSPFPHIANDKITVLDKTQVHHMRDVLRLKLKDKLIIFDDKGNEYICSIEKISETITLSIKDRRLSFPKNKGLKITLACALPKRAKMEDIIDKLTQLAVDRIIPLETERVIVNLDKNKKLLRQRRWQKIAISSSQQSQRNTIPSIDFIKNIKEVLCEAKDFDLKLLPTLSGKRQTLKEIFNCNLTYKNILILIGPEGDFSEAELDLAIKNGCIPVTLGELVLRVETAAIAVVSILNYIFKHG